MINGDLIWACIFTAIACGTAAFAALGIMGLLPNG